MNGWASSDRLTNLVLSLVYGMDNSARAKAGLSSVVQGRKLRAMASSE
jgi:hypothetical protein